MTTVYFFENANSSIGNSVYSLEPQYKGNIQLAIAEAIKNQGLPEDTPYQEVEDSLEPVFKNARKVENGKLIADLTKAKLIAHEYRRVKRSREFLVIDSDNRNVVVTPAAEAQRESIRAKYEIIQTNLDAKSTVAELKAEMEKEGLI